jgi:hypothetical protein
MAKSSKNSTFPVMVLSESLISVWRGGHFPSGSSPSSLVVRDDVSVDSARLGLRKTEMLRKFLEAQPDMLR